MLFKLMGVVLPCWVCRPAAKGSVHLGDVMAVMRDYYQGTPFDMTVAALCSILAWRPLPVQ